MLERFLKVWSAVWAVLLVIVLFLIFVILPNYSRVMTAFKPFPEHFTELYFENHLELPKVIKPGDEFNVSFTVKNLEGVPMNYEGTIFVETTATDEANLNESLFSWNFELPNNRSETFTKNLRLPNNAPTFARGKVAIKLTNIDESIHFWFHTATDSSQVLWPQAPATSSASPSPLTIFPEQQ